MRPPIVIISGPTAAGKTGLSIALAKQFGAEVVNADSMQVFRGFDIGTAKPDTEEQQGVPHHLLDIVNADEPFDAARFVDAADAAIEDIVRREKRVLLVGGTGLYIRTLLHGLQEGPPPDPNLRRELARRAETEGRTALHAALNEVDPASAARLHPNDLVRVIRALEVTITSGIPMSEWQKKHGFAEERYKFLLLGVLRPRGVLNEIIDARVDRMMQQGFLNEVQGLLSQGISPRSKPMQALGYRRLVEYLEGELSLEEAVVQIKTDTRRFAKRQMTWFNKEAGLEWIEPDIEVATARCAAFWR